MAHRWLLVCLLCASLSGALPTHAAGTTYRTAFTRWRASNGDFAAWQRNGVVLTTSGSLQLDPATAASATDPYAAGSYNGGNFYNGASFLVGEATSPIQTSSFAWSEAIASWNANTPSGSWIETLVRVQIGTRWSKWYNLGIWAADTSTVRRHSVRSQADTDATVAVDTLVVTNKTKPTQFQVKVRLFGAGGVPSLRNAALAVSTTPSSPRSLTPGNTSLWNRRLAVPACSQMVYTDGGEVWCSPTSTSMVLGYWQNDTGACEPRVRAAVAGVYDWIYNGHGNWPFNTAYAATQQLDSYVVRFTSLAQLEPWIAAGVPVIFSFAWSKGQLTGAAIPSSAGHLAVLVGFDAAGNPIVNDPAAATDAGVPRTYIRSELETLWLTNSGGTVYLIFPASQSVPNL